MLFIGVDLGTSAVKLILADESGKVLKVVSKEYPVSFPHSGWSEQNPTDWYDKSIEGIKELLTAGTDQITLDGKYTKFERIADDMKLKYVKDAKYVSFGIEPLIGYLIAKEMEIKNLRIILTGKVTEVPVEKISERLRDTYV